jgi:hypothetical protein
MSSGYIAFPGPKMSKDEVVGALDAIAWLTSKRLIVVGAADDWHKFMEATPHAHLPSMMGPYCVACRCSLPGPNGEWE